MSVLRALLFGRGKYYWGRIHGLSVSNNNINYMIIRNPGVILKVSFIDYCFVFLCVIFLGSATVFTYGSLENFGFGIDAGFESVIGKSLMIALSVYLLNRHRVTIANCFNFRICVVILFWGLLQIFKYKQFSTYPFVRIFNLYFASVLIFCYGKNLIYLLEDVIVKLSKIDVVIWIFMLLMPELIDLLMSLSPIKGSGLVEGNSWVVYASGFQYEIVKRNIGFAWEPGRFGSIVTVAVFFNLIIHKFNLKGNSNFIWLTVALLSTQSTTAYIGYLVALAFFLYNKKSEYFVRVFPFVACFFIILMSMDFMADKLKDLSIFNEEHNAQWAEDMEYYATQDGFLVPQRFDALLLEGLNILHDPLLGNATDTYSYLYGLFGIKFSLSNGVLRIFANMGIFIGILYYLLCIHSSAWMSRVYEYKGSMCFFIMFLVINFSYSWIFEPIFLSFILYPFIAEKQGLFGPKSIIADVSKK